MNRVQSIAQSETVVPPSAAPREGPPIDDQIVAALRRLMRAVDLQSRRLVEQCGLTVPQLLVLRQVAGAGRVAVGELAQRVRLSQPTVTGIVDRLERRGLVSRERSERDRRCVIVMATPAGREVLGAAPSLLQDRFRSELARLHDWEQTMILATLQRVAEMLDVEQIDAAAVLLAGPVDAPGEAAVVAGGVSPAGRGVRVRGLCQRAGGSVWRRSVRRVRQQLEGWRMADAGQTRFVAQGGVSGQVGTK